jgi:hypothetical protein
MTQDTADPKPDVSRLVVRCCVSHGLPRSPRAPAPVVKKGSGSKFSSSPALVAPALQSPNASPRARTAITTAAPASSHPLRRPLLAAVATAVVFVVARHLRARGSTCCPFPVTGRAAEMAAPRGPDHAIKLFGRTIALPNSAGAAAEVRARPQPFWNRHCPRVLGGGRVVVTAGRRVWGNKRDQMHLFSSSFKDALGL